MKRVAWLFFPLLLGACATTTQVMTGTARAPLAPEAVRTYTQAPPGAQEIAQLTASSRNSFRFGSQAKLDVALGRLKAAAARLGANGIVLEGTATRSSGSIGTGGSVGSFGSRSAVGLGTGISVPMTQEEIRGRAIYVPEPGSAPPGS